MKLEYWQTIFKAYRQAQVLLDQWLPVEAAPTQALPPARVGRAGLAQLQQQLLVVVDSLQGVLGKAYGSDEIDEAMHPFCYLLDEMVLRRLIEAEQPDWPLLQYARYGEDSGGDLFYELADRKLQRPGPTPLVYEMLHFCLTAGFGGRYLGNVAKLREYKERLAACIPKPEPIPPPPPAAIPETPLLYEFPARYYIGSTFFILGLPVVLWLLST